LGKHFLGDGFVGADNMHTTGSFTVESHCFGEGLSNNEFETLVDEVSETQAILVEVATDEALVSGIEEGKQLVASAYFSNLFPLI